MRVIARVAAATAITCVAAATGLASAQARADGTVSVAVGEWPPFLGTDLDGHGLYATQVADTLAAAGWEVDFNFMPWQRALAEVASGQFDASLPWKMTSDRQRRFLYSDAPISKDHFVIFYNKTRFPEGLKGETLGDFVDNDYIFVAVSVQWTNEFFAEQDIEFETVHRPEQAWLMLQAGRVDAYIENRIAGLTDARSVLGNAANAVIGYQDIGMVNDLYMIFPRTRRGEQVRAVWDAAAAHRAASNAAGSAVTPVTD